MSFLSDIAPLALGGIGAALGGLPGAVIGSSMGSSLSSAQGVADQNEANAAQSVKQMEFQERMSNTAHQREVEDLRAAGLNPILSAGGGGASAPSGSSAQMLNKAPDFSHAVTSAIDAKTAVQNLENLKEQQKLTEFQTKKTELDAEAAYANQSIAKNEMRASSAMLQARNGQLDNTLPENKYWNQQAALEKTEFSARSAEARRSAIDNAYGIKNAAILNNLDTAQKGANVLSTGASILKPWTSTTGAIKDNRKTHYHVNKQTGEYK